MKYFCLSLLFVYFFTSVRGGPEKDTKFQFKVISIKDCNNSKDSFKVRRVSFEPLIEVPGIMSFNMSGSVKRKLPSDWDANVKIKVKIPWFNNWVEVPCMGKCELKNLCDEERIQFCKYHLNKTNSILDPEKTCLCDYEPGNYNIPTVSIPIKDSYFKYNENFGESMINTVKGKDIKMDVILRSSFDQKRFGCLNAMLKLL